MEAGEYTETQFREVQIAIFVMTMKREAESWYITILVTRIIYSVMKYLNASSLTLFFLYSSSLFHPLSIYYVFIRYQELLSAENNGKQGKQGSYSHSYCMLGGGKRK